MNEEERLEAFRAHAHERELAAACGVAWAGLGPETFRPRSTAALRSDAQDRHSARAAWRNGAAGRALTALAEVERHAEAIRAALARDPAQDLTARGSALAAAAAAVLTALR